jgi:hypothetical protein
LYLVLISYRNENCLPYEMTKTINYDKHYCCYVLRTSTRYVRFIVQIDFYRRSVLAIYRFRTGTQHRFRIYRRNGDMVRNEKY